MITHRRFNKIYGFSLLAAVCLTLVPVKTTMLWWLPDLPLIWVLCWTLIAPERVGLVTVFLVGLLVDLLLGSLLGSHAISYVIVGCIAFHVRLPFKFYPLWQQFILFALFGLINALVLYWINALVGRDPLYWQYWGQVLSCALCWPIISFLLHSLPRKASSVR